METNNRISDFFKDRISINEVVKILNLIADPPNLREKPLPNDLAGDFDKWFDGGGLKHGTIGSTYHFVDGAKAIVFSLAPRLSLIVQFPNNEEVVIEQKRVEPVFDQFDASTSNEITYGGGDGETIVEAVIVHGANNDLAGTIAEFQWLTERFGHKDIDWQLETHAHGRINDKEIDTIVIRLPSGAQTTIYFDVTESFGRM
jgi:hypothetical protein